MDCSTALPHACALTSSDSSSKTPLWGVDLQTAGSWEKSSCSSSFGNGTFAAPTDGFSNALLLNAAFGQTVWLNAPNSFVNQ